MGRLTLAMVVLSLGACDYLEGAKEDPNVQVIQFVTCFTPAGELLFTGQAEDVQYSRGLWAVVIGNRVLSTNGQCFWELFKVQTVEEPKQDAEQGMAPPPEEPDKAAGIIDENTWEKFVLPWEGTL